jgi:hypothetical protein
MVGITELAEATKKAFGGGPIITANCEAQVAKSEFRFGFGGLFSCLFHTNLHSLLSSLSLFLS